MASQPCTLTNLLSREQVDLEPGNWALAYGIGAKEPRIIDGEDFFLFICTAVSRMFLCIMYDATHINRSDLCTYATSPFHATSTDTNSKIDPIVAVSIVLTSLPMLLLLSMLAAETQSPR